MRAQRAKKQKQWWEEEKKKAAYEDEVEIAAKKDARVKMKCKGCYKNRTRKAQSDTERRQNAKEMHAEGMEVLECGSRGCCGKVRKYGSHEDEGCVDGWRNGLIVYKHAKLKASHASS